MRLPLLAALTLLLAGCTAPTPAGPADDAAGPTNGTSLGGTPGAPQRPDPQGTPPPAPTSPPAPDANATRPPLPGPEDRDATGAIVVTLTLDKPRLAPGEVITATAVAENRGTEPRTYQHGGCPGEQFLVRIEGTEEPFRPPIGFWNYSREPQGCAAMIYTATLQPGQRVVEQVQWNGHTGHDADGPHDGPAVPPGTYTVTATFLALETDRGQAEVPITVG